MSFGIRVRDGHPVDLRKIDPEQDGGLSKEEGAERLAELGKRLADLHELLFAAGTHALLIVFQGRDTAGKDGAINRLLEFINVQSCRVSPFKVPTEIELAHDFLWRVHAETPGRGSVAIFNRSHYEDVLVVRVQELAPEKVWKGRYEHINAFEKLLADANTIIVKFCLHISPEEQRERLLAREQELEKAWKLSAGDWKEREHWEAYTDAYNDALNKCSPDHAPWVVVPANKKWYRDLVVAETLIERLAPLEETWRAKLAKIGEEAKAELAEYRATNPL